MFASLNRRFGVILKGKFSRDKVMADYSFPETLIEFGYAFDQGGKLRKVDDTTGTITNDGFEFNVREDLDYNQKRYEALGQLIDNYVYELLEKEGLKKLPVPKEVPSKQPELKSFIFASEDAFENDKLMVLIHGSGVVRAGQWARRLIINDSLNTGTQLPYIKKAREMGYAVMVLNTNDNFRTVNGKPVEIPGSGDPHIHVETVWKEYIEPSKAKRIAIVAHSYGGVCTVKFAMKHVEDFRNRVFAVGLTDSVHTIAASENAEHILKALCGSEQALKWIFDHSRLFIIPTHVNRMKKRKDVKSSSLFRGCGLAVAGGAKLGILGEALGHPGAHTEWRHRALFCGT